MPCCCCRLLQARNGSVPIGAVESCVSGTSVQRWQPPGTDPHDSYNCTYRGHNVCGDLWTNNIEPLLPLTVSAVLWDQGEADAKRNNASWYRSVRCFFFFFFSCFWGGFFLMYLYRALRGCSYGSRGFLEDR